MEAYLCPWCGISDNKWVWEQWKRRCIWCGIMSQAPMSDTYMWREFPVPGKKS